LRELPRGIDVNRDIAQAFPSYEVAVVFDVGANFGQSALKYLAWYPSAVIHCFEPVGSNFNALKGNLSGWGRVRCLNLALGSASGNAEMVLEGASSMFHLDSVRDHREAVVGSRTEKVEISTVD
jgi:FkbM family methyltransferase